MSEKNPEVVGCDASIMKNVWEIRLREQQQKLQLEQDRIENSALPSINNDWANRMAGKVRHYKMVERKPKPVETDNNIWKSKQPQIPPTLPRGAGPGPLSRPVVAAVVQSRGVTTHAPKHNDIKMQDKKFNRLQLLMFITQTPPLAMEWEKSWKYNKSLPSPATEYVTDWGQSWMFATQQPYIEAGKSWPDGPNTIDPHSLHLWKKPDNRMMKSQDLDLSLSTKEWQMSWKKSEKTKKAYSSSVHGESTHRSGGEPLLLETQHHNKALCLSEWSGSWRSTKPASQRKHHAVPNDGLMNESLHNRRDKNSEMRARWAECWRIVNHHGCKSQLSQLLKTHRPEWVNSWRAASVVVSNHKNSAPSLEQGHSDTYDGCIQQKESHLHKIILASHGQKNRDLYVQLCREFKDLSEWSKSWQVSKNKSKPCEEIEKVPKALPQVKDNIYQSKREFTKSTLLLLKHVENALISAQWTDSWKTPKHGMRMARRRMRPDPLKPLRESEKGGDMKPTASDWKDSWKFTCHPLCQQTELWQQGWWTTPQTPKSGKLTLRGVAGSRRGEEVAFVGF